MIYQITDPADPRLAPYANLTDAQLRGRDFQGERPVFMAESELVVRRLLTSRFPIESLLLSPHGARRLADVTPTITAPILIADEALVQNVVGFPFHRGILACARRLPDTPLAELLACRVLMVLEDTANTDNMGAIFRNAACLIGRDCGVILSPGCCDPLYRKALRVSIGHALTIPFTRAPAWPDVLTQLAEAGFEVLGMTPEGGALALDTVANGGRVALLMGAEGPGLTPGALARCTRRVRIPMAEGADSLNVATAAAVALSHLVRLD